MIEKNLDHVPGCYAHGRNVLKIPLIFHNNVAVILHAQVWIVFISK